MDQRLGPKRLGGIPPSRSGTKPSGVGRALVLHPVLGSTGPWARGPEAALDEVVGLARAIGLTVAHGEAIAVSRPRSATLFGKGAVARFAEFVAANGIAVAVIDTSLTPGQQRNLERAWWCKVIDRTGLILEIFGARARTREGQLQVELAALNYQRSRLVRSWTHLERQRGGAGFLGGPGERQLEIDRRIITDRISRIKSDLEQVRRTRALHRAARRRVPYPVVALVGYTNAGKSTLFNRLTRSDVVAEDRLFSTLDPTMRVVRLASGLRIILSDTVGFISDLPTDLVAAFRATLEEVSEADLIVHVRDVAHRDSEGQGKDVDAILDQLGLGDREEHDRIEVLNKSDLLDSSAKESIGSRAARLGGQVLCAALTGDGIADLTAMIDRRLTRGRKLVDLAVDLTDGAAIAWLYERGQILGRRDDERHAHLRLRIAPADLARFDRRRTPERRRDA